MLNPPSSNNVKASKAWSLRALQLADQALNETIPDEKVQVTCERARIVTEFNLGMLSEVSPVFRIGVTGTESSLQMESDVPQAVRYLQRAQTHARSVGFKDAAREATDSLQRLRQLGKAGEQ
jgi:hypothetical protein